MRDLIWQALARIEDPELPIAITEMGMVQTVAVEGDAVRVELLPTYTGCPALEVIRERAQASLLTVPG